MEQIVDISPGDDRGQVSSSFAGPADEDFPGVFRTFPHGKKSAECQVGQCGPAPARQFIHAGGSARLGSVVGVTHSFSAGRVGGGQGSHEEERGGGGSEEVEGGAATEA